MPALAVVAGLSGYGWRDGEEAARALQFAVEWGSRVRLLAAVLDALKGSKAAEIVRPITITKKNDDGEVESTFTRFKSSKCIFGYNQTEGEELPPVETSGWDRLGPSSYLIPPDRSDSGNFGTH